VTSSWSFIRQLWCWCFTTRTAKCH